MSNIFKFPQTTKLQKGSRVPNKAQVIEQLRSVGDGALNSLNNDLLKEAPQEIFKQMFGLPEKRVRGDLVPGEALEVKDAISGQDAENRQLKAQLSQERQMRMDGERIATVKQKDLRMQLSVVTSEVQQLAQTTHGLSREIQIAAIQAPVDPGTYHIIFFEKLIEFIRDFRKKIENASVWTASYNTKSKKRANSFWGQVGVGGAKRLLSAEDYSQRAAA